MGERFVRFVILVSITGAVAGCSTVSDFVSANLPERHEGRASVVVKLREQQAYLYRSGYQVATSRISSGGKAIERRLGASTSFKRMKTTARGSTVIMWMRLAK
jgi:hypothetical protein